MKLHAIRPLVLLTFAALASCAIGPESNSMLEQARADYGSAQANSQVTSLAPSELKQAGDTLDKANAASSKGEDRVIVDHLAYVAKQQVAIARETATQKAAELAVANAGAERDRVRLAARTREADMAQRNAESSQRSAETSQRSAEASQRNAEASQRNADASQRRSEASLRSAEDSQRQATAERLAALDAQQNAQSARQQTQDAESRSRVLEAQLRELDARKTDRGIVVTLGDVLFDTNDSRLKMTGISNVRKLADFFKQYPQRTVAIEGFTDSTGSARRNQELSNDRAGSVRTALLSMGINNDRISSRGFGESFPVATNDTVAGRQLNRRVEMIVSDDSGKIAPR
jgi:outer membrane protein OmpA-like peptidoglycan-associated protein